MIIINKKVSVHQQKKKKKNAKKVLFINSGHCHLLSSLFLPNFLMHFLVCVYCCFILVEAKMSSSTGKRKEIYKYVAPWLLYSMNWSVRPDKRFRLALGSFVEEYNNKVQIISLDEETSEFSAKR